MGRSWVRWVLWSLSVKPLYLFTSSMCHGEAQVMWRYLTSEELNGLLVVVAFCLGGALGYYCRKLVKE